MAVGHIVRIFNRTPFVLTATKDGRQYRIKPGYSHLTADVVPFARAQNPVMGTEDPQTLGFESLISRVADAENGEEQHDPLDTLSEDILASMPKERVNRMLLDSDRQRNVEEIGTTFPRRNVRVEGATEGMVDPGDFGGRGD